MHSIASLILFLFYGLTWVKYSFSTLSSHSANLPNVSIPSTHYSESRCSSCHLKSDFSLFIIYTIFLNICNMCGIFQQFKYFLSNCTISHYLLLMLHVLLFATIFCDLFTIYQFIYLFQFYLWLCLWLYTSCIAFSIPFVFVPSITINLLSFMVLKHLLQQSVIHLYEFYINHMRVNYFTPF